MSELDPVTEVDPLGPEQHWANLMPMIAYLAAVGVLLSIAAWQDWGWAFTLGLVLTAVWIVGFIVSKDRLDARWFRW